MAGGGLAVRLDGAAVAVRRGPSLHRRGGCGRLRGRVGGRRCGAGLHGRGRQVALGADVRLPHCLVGRRDQLRVLQRSFVPTAGASGTTSRRPRCRQRGRRLGHGLQARRVRPGPLAGRELTSPRRRRPRRSPLRTRTAHRAHAAPLGMTTLLSLSSCPTWAKIRLLGVTKATTS